MKQNNCLLVIFLLSVLHSFSQDCDNIHINSTGFESRCAATGYIVIHAVGGTGNFNYKVTGPVNTPYTTVDTITGLPSGRYKVWVEDVAAGCVVAGDSVTVDGSYSDPRYFLSKKDVTCRGNDGEINVIGLSGGRSPFSYKIVAAPSSGLVGTTTTDGHFGNLMQGDYSIEVQDSCGGIQVRWVTVDTLVWFWRSGTVSRVGCDSAEASITLQDNKGNILTSGAALNGFSFGVVLDPGDTLWSANSTFRFKLNKARYGTLVAKDPCGTTLSSNWALSPNQIPKVDTVLLSNYECSTFSATVNGENLTNPQYCLYSSSGLVIECNTTGIFDHVGYGSYCIKVNDVCYDTTIQRCFTATKPIPEVAATVDLSQMTCSDFTATITGQANLFNPAYCIFNSTGTLVDCNSIGRFVHLPYGDYCIHTKDGCYDSTIQRCFTAKRPLPGIASVGIISPYCNSFDVTVVGQTGTPAAKYCLYDDKGNLVTCDSAGVFKGIIHGNYCIKAISLCGDTTAPYCFYTQAPKPTVGDTVNISNRTCKTFTASIGGISNLTSPQYCLYDASNNLVGCDTTGIFDSIPYGNYCIKVKDGCYDTTIIRCFSASHPVVVISASLSQSNKTCTDFTLNVTGTNLSTPWYSLYTSSGQSVDSNSTGIFDHLLYGNYCVNVQDGCADTTLHICQDFTKVKGISLATYKTCTIGYGVVSAQVKSRNNPYTFTFYHPDGHVVYSQTTWSDYVSTELLALPAGARYKIVAVDNCGQEDIGYISPDATIVDRNIDVTNKCPSAIWQDGSGDLTITYNSNLFDLKPLLISKDGSAISQSYTNTNGYDSYIFSDLGPGTYVMESTMEACNSKVYDTFQIKPYTFPKQVQSAIYQCNNNSFTLSGNVEGGVGPYGYQIIGSQPSSPDITTGIQNSPLFTINNGTTYSLIRLRSVDACGNAALSDVSVLPLQNIVIKANTTCFYQNVILSVDTIPNATYQWFKRSNSGGDSTLIGTNLTFSIPFMEDSNIGTYVCKVSVNTDCLTRMSTFTLNGVCDDHPLPVGMQLKGIKTKEGNRLNWSITKEVIKYFIIERSSGKDKAFTEIGKVYAESSLPGYSFIDGMPMGGNNCYRLKIIDQHGNFSYSNIVTLKNITFHSMVYPNPITKDFYLTLSSNSISNYRIELYSLSGQKIYTQKLSNITNGTFNFRKPIVTNGNYFLNVVNETTGESEGFKIEFQ